MADFAIKENDTLPKLVATLFQGPDAIDLTGATVKLKMRKLGAVVLKVDKAITVTTPASGEVEYSFLATETDDPGNYEAEFEVTDSGGDVFTVPTEGYLDFVVGDDLDDTP